MADKQLPGALILKSALKDPAQKYSQASIRYLPSQSARTTKFERSSSTGRRQENPFSAPTTKREIAFIDRNIDDLQTFLAGLRPEVEAILLSNDEPAPRQMARAVAKGQRLDAIHVIAHGRPAAVAFAAGALSLDNLDDYATELAEIGRALRGGALRLWSCTTAGGRRGAEFVEALARVTGAEVAAAIGLVGAAARGGSWELENLRATTPQVAPLTAAGLVAYAGTLDTNTATVTVTSTTTSNTVSDGSGTNTVTVSSTTGSNTVSDGNGANTVAVTSITGSNTVSDGNGTNTVAVASTTGSNTVSDGNGTDTVTVSSTTGSNNVSDGNGTNTVTVSSTTGNNNVSDGNGTNTVTVSSTTGNSTVSDGNGTNTVAVSGGSATVTDGNGTNLVYAAGTTGNDTITDGNGTNVIVGGSGNDTITDGNGTDIIYGGSGNDTIKDGNGNDVVIGGAGSDNITTGNGTDLAIYALSDHYTVTSTPAGATLTSIHNDVDNYNAGNGTDTLRVVLTAAEYAIVQSQLAGFATWLAANKGSNQTYYFNFATGASGVGGDSSLGAGGGLVVGGWENLQLQIVNPGQVAIGYAATTTGSLNNLGLFSDTVGTSATKFTDTFKIVGLGAGSTGPVATSLDPSLNVAQYLDGTATLPTSYTVTGQDGILTLNSDGTYSYTVTSHTVATDVFTIETLDQNGFVTSTTLNFGVSSISVAISGTAREGQTLAAVVTGADSDDSLSYQWKVNGLAVSGATGSTYMVREGDEGKTITVTATAADNSGHDTETSANTSTVLDAAPTVTTPTISGTAQEGQTLTASASSGQADNPVTYQWQLDGINISGATGATYLVQEGDETHKIDVVATTTNDNGVTISATSANTSTVLDAAPTVTTPTISGTAQEGQTLTASASSGQADNPVTYQWQLDGINISGATGATYLVQEGDETHKIDVVATTTNDNGVTISATSANTSTVLDAAPTVTTPTISGTAQEGQTLTASASSGQADNPVTYQWQLDGINISGATGATYLVQEGDETHKIDVVATTTNDNGVTISATSANTSTVLDAAPTVTTPTISGTAQEGQTLTASASSGQADNPVTYQWQLDGINISGATGATYLVQEGDETHKIDVVATTTNDNGVTISATSANTSTVLDAAPTVTTPTISGTAQEGQTLTASASSGQADNPVTYQWQLDGINISGATGATYLVQEGDETHKIDVVATTTNDNGVTISATSANTSTVLDAAPTVTTPTISGTAQEGQTLTASASSGQADNPVTYQWQLDGINISGATGATYLVQEGDETHKIDVVATTTNDNGVTISATSANTSTVLDAAPTVTTPTSSGTAQEGQTLTASASSGQADNPVTYQWQLDGINISGATGATLSRPGRRRDPQDRRRRHHHQRQWRHHLRHQRQHLDGAGRRPHRHHPHNFGYRPGRPDAHRLGKLRTGRQSRHLSVAARRHQHLQAPPAPPISSRKATRPTRSTSSPPPPTTMASPSPPPAPTPRRCWTPPPPSPPPQFRVPPRKARRSPPRQAPDRPTIPSPISGSSTASTSQAPPAPPISSRKATRPTRSTSSPPPPTTMASPSPPPAPTPRRCWTPPPPSPPPQFRVPPRKARTLTASASSGQADNPVTYQWQLDGINISGATGATYLVQEGDETHKIDVVATTTNDNGVTISATSANTSTVLDAAPTVTTPTISGTALEGQTLTDSASSGQADNPVTYQWQLDGINIPGATGATYLVQEGDETHKIDVVATTTNDNGVTISATSANTSTVLDAAPTVTTPTISGTAQEGQTLTASASSGQADNPVTYQFQHDGINITGATGATNHVQEGDETNKIDVVATTTNDNGVTISATSANTSTVLDAAPTVTTPTISGTAQEGQTLTASASSGQADNPVTYQWQLDGINISGATGATYLVQEGDETHKIDVVATTTNDNGVTISATSANTSTVLDAAPTVTTPHNFGYRPGRPDAHRLGKLRTGRQSRHLSVAARRHQHPSGATGATYLVQEGDETHKIDVVATTTNDNGVTISGTSANTSRLLDAAPPSPPPQFRVPPRKARRSPPRQAPDRTTIQSPISGSSTASTSQAPPAPPISSRKATSPTRSTSSPPPPTTMASPSPPPAPTPRRCWTPPPPSPPPQFRVPPRKARRSPPRQAPDRPTIPSPISGSSTASTSQAPPAPPISSRKGTRPTRSTSSPPPPTTMASPSPPPAPTPRRCWTPPPPSPPPQFRVPPRKARRSPPRQAPDRPTIPSPISGSSTASTSQAPPAPPILVQEGDETHKIDVVATTTNDNGVTISATSANTSTVLDAAPTVTTPTISGTAQEGQTLTASASSGQADNPVTYQWQLDGINISGATGATYLVQEGDETHKIDVVATTTNDNGVTISATSANTSTVLDAAPTVTTPTISGTAQEGQTLTASASSGQADNPVTYQWQLDGINISGATGATYLVQEGDETHKIDVVATTTNDNGVTISATSANTSTVLDAAPTVTTPTISGTAQEGQTLTASASSGQADNPVTYQWQLDGINISGRHRRQLSGPGSQRDRPDPGGGHHHQRQWRHHLRHQRQHLDGAGRRPHRHHPHNFGGTAQEGQTLTASASAGQSDNPVTYQWQLDGINISGATGATHLVQEGDEGAKIEVVATTTNDNGVTISATSANTSTVLDAAPTVTTPTSSGTAQEGQTLTASSSSGQADNPVTYQWQLDGINISGATGATYLVQEGDETHKIDVVATTTNDNGVTISATSAPTAAVTDITLAFTTAATISGTAQEGQVLTAVNGTLNDADASVTGYQWTRDGVNISGATSSTYTVTEADETHVIRVVETATDADGGPTTTSTSAATSAVTDIAPAISNNTITGTAQEGQVLTANATANDADAVLNYQWQELISGTWTNISGATNSNYTVQESDETHQIRVNVGSTDSDGTTLAAASSAATSAVLDAAPTFATGPTISGSAQEGATLTGSATAGERDNPITYQWMFSPNNGNDFQNITGATNSTYTVQESDEGHRIEVVATVTNDNGVTTSQTSAATSAVTDITLAFTTAASITGTAKEGQVLTAVNGTLNDSDAAVTGYQWTRDGANISGATASTYTVTEADETHVIRVVETATDADGGPPTTSTSAATSAVTDITLAFTTAASITGTAQEGQVLTAVNGTLNDADASVTGYQWTRDGVNISGATSSTYTVTEADETHVIRVVETATDADGGPTTTSTSAPTAAVTDITLAFTTAASITGTAQEGQVLTAVNGTR